MPHTNQLINETSPYLLQHAHNPVNWYPWGEEALNRSAQENKPILVSIGYAACHWCHVMERESFENEETAAFMNEHFINIKIDREERPDLDHIYMDAVQAMTGSGGWPLNVFLTPDSKPFYGGTYFPPQRAFNRPSWMETLQAVSQAFQTKRHEIDAQAANLTTHLREAGGFGLTGDTPAVFEKQKLAETAASIMKIADKHWGGFGKAPKFPQTFSILFLLRYGGEEELQQALLSLDKMINGGIYDQLGGGFARYSTDTEWLAPHFEKMLYDNALLLSVLSEAFQRTGKERYREVIGETIGFVKRELMDKGSGFYSALDADSEGVEGKYYVWTYDEVQKILGDDAGVFCDYYDVTAKGNWENVNILRVKKDLNAFAADKEMDAETLRFRLADARRKLENERSKRVRPLLDDKIILGWNALMNTAASKAFAATGNKEYRELALANMHFLLEHFYDEKEGRYYHTWKNGQAKYPAFLDDHALLIDALIHLQEITGDVQWLNRAKEILQLVDLQFSEEESDFFYYTPAYQMDVILRKREVYDGAVPSGNSVMAYNLYRLGILFDEKSWMQRAADMVRVMSPVTWKYANSFGNWACLYQEMVEGTKEIVIGGDKTADLHMQVLSFFIPHKVLMVASVSSRGFPLTEGRPVDGEASVYLCSNYTCQLPVFSAKDLMSLINRGQNN